MTSSHAGSSPAIPTYGLMAKLVNAVGSNPAVARLLSSNLSETTKHIEVVNMRTAHHPVLYVTRHSWGTSGRYPARRIEPLYSDDREPSASNAWVEESSAKRRRVKAEMLVKKKYISGTSHCIKTSFRKAKIGLSDASIL